MSGVGVDPTLQVDPKILPNRLSNLRACLQCKLIKTEVQFAEEGCDNCPNVGLSNLSSYTTPTFQGMLGCYDPQRSWVARWQRQSELLPPIHSTQSVHEASTELR